MADLNVFINQYKGQKVASRGGITGECVSLVQRWAEVNGVSGSPVFPVAAAKDMAGSRGDAFTWIANTPSNQPVAGDIVVMNERVGGGYGHTGVVTAANLNTFNMFDQWNISGGATAGVRTYNYNSVSGWLRLKNQGDNVGVPNTEYDRVVIENYNLGVSLRNTEAKLTEVANIADTREKQIRDITKVATGKEGYDPDGIIAAIKDLQNRPTGGGADKETKDLVKENNNILKQIWDKISSIFK